MRTGGGETQWELNPNDNTHPSFWVSAFELLYSHPNLVNPFCFPPPPSLLPLALENTAMPPAKVSRCTSPNNRSGAPAPRRPPAAGRTPSPVLRLPRTRPCSLGSVAPRGPDAAVRAPGDTRALMWALGPVSGTRGEIASRQCCALAPAARVALLFLSGLQFAADIGERWAGRTAGGWGWREVGRGSGRKKSLSGQLSRVGWGVEGGGELQRLASPNPRGRRECVRA